MQKNVVKTVFPNPFLKNQNQAYSFRAKVLNSLFWLYAKLRVIEIYETKVQTTCFYLIQFFLKIKRRL